jgi:hypothetical protein
MADDAVEAALNSWWPDHGDRGWANGTPTDRLWYEKMSRALAAADAARLVHAFGEGRTTLLLKQIEEHHSIATAT